MKNKRLEVFLILIIAEGLLLALAWLFSGDALPEVTDKIRFMSISEMFDFSVNHENEVADSLLQQYIADTSNSDSLLKRHSLSRIGPKKKNVFLINPENEGMTALDNFFKALYEEKDTCVIRIAHYGDSQCEGDRMSWIIREKFHEKFGGTGVGYVPFKDLSPVSYTRYSSGNWTRFTVFHDRYSNSYYGLSGLVFHFSRYAVFQPDDDNGQNNDIKDTHKVKVGSTYNSASVSVKLGENLKYNRVSVLYGRTNDYTLLNYYDIENGNRLASDTLPPAKEVVLKTRIMDEPVLKLKLEFSASNSPDFYGVYLDGNNGVQVDNYAIRGHSGDGLMLIDDDHLARMIKLLNTRLIIFQYGMNVVPYIRSDKACQSIEELYYQLFMKFRKAAPDVSILVVSSGDMARGGEGGYSSYPWLPKIVLAQKNAALKAGCAFFDIFDMMGGPNSILVWTQRKLAVTNGHFSSLGQEIIASELVEALMVEYNMYLHKHRNNKS